MLGFLLLVSGVRGRRATANLAALTGLVSLGLTLLVAWARFGLRAPYKYSFPWISTTPSFSGAAQFQTFQIDVGYRVDHAALAVLAVLSLVFLGCLYWHRAATRSESGPARLHALALLLLFAGAGVAVSGDLAELLAFWSLAGVASWLLLAHRWGAEPAGAASRLALAVPFVGDLSLLLGIGLLYSRYGSLDLDKLYPVLLTTPGAGQKALTAACILLFAGAAARAALFPFWSWQTGTLESPPALGALVQGVWPLLSGILIYRSLPILAVAGPQAGHVAAYWAGGAALLAGAVALLGSDLRRALTLAGSAASGLGLSGLVSSGGPPGLAVLLSVALARPAVILAAAAVVAAMRTGSLLETGGGWRRMRQSSTALGLGGLALALGGGITGAWRADALSWRAGLVWLAALLVGLAVGRVWAGVALGPLRRRRAFEPERVRDPAPPVTGPAVALAVLALVATGLAFLTRWLDFLAGASHPGPMPQTFVLWEAAGLLGLLLGVAAVGSRRDLALRLADTAGRRLGVPWTVGTRIARVYLFEPWLRSLESFERRWLPRGEAELGSSLAAFAGSAAVLAARLPVLPALVIAAVVLAIVVALLSPGLAR